MESLIWLGVFACAVEVDADHDPARTEEGAAGCNYGDRGSGGQDSRNVATSQREKRSTTQRAVEDGQALLRRRVFGNRHLAKITYRDDTG